MLGPNSMQSNHFIWCPVSFVVSIKICIGQSERPTYQRFEFWEPKSFCGGPESQSHSLQHTRRTSTQKRQPAADYQAVASKVRLIWLKGLLCSNKVFQHSQKWKLQLKIFFKKHAIITSIFSLKTNLPVSFILWKRVPSMISSDGIAKSKRAALLDNITVVDTFLFCWAWS